MTGKSFKNLLFCLSTLMLIVCGRIVVAQTVTTSNPVIASIQPAKVTVGDSVSYQVAVSVPGAGQPSVAVPVIDPDTGLSTPVNSGSQTSSETYIVGSSFRTVQTITYVYTIRTSKIGKFVIPPATVTLNGKTYESEPVDLEVIALPEVTNVPEELKGWVVPPQVNGSAELQRKLTGVIFVLPVVSNMSPYNGEQVRISYHLVFQRDALTDAGLLPRTNLDNYKVPEMSEFIKEELYPFPSELKFQERDIGGKIYLIAPVYEAVITSTKSGQLNIDPFQISMIFSQRNQGVRSQSPYGNDPFLSMNPMAFMGSAVQVIAQSPTLTLDVKPVPDKDRPVDFAGAVGQLNVISQVDKKQAKANDDTIQLDVIVEGEGNTESLSPPTLPDMPAFNVLGSPEQESGGRKEKDKYLSTKKFSYTLRPVTPGTHSIPAIGLSVFEPTKAAFFRAESDPISIEIAPGSGPVVPPTSATPANPEKPQPSEAETDFRYISTEDLTSNRLIDKLFRGSAAVVMFVIPLSLVGFAAFSKWATGRKGHKRQDSRKAAEILAQKHFKSARHALSNGQNQEMYSEVSEGIRYYFAGRYGLPVNEITIVEIEERLEQAGAPAELVEKLSSILETCDSAQYAPSKSVHNEGDVLKEVEMLIKTVETYT